VIVLFGDRLDRFFDPVIDGIEQHSLIVSREVAGFCHCVHGVISNLKHKHWRGFSGRNA
jgi:hypothetical protein